MGKWKKKGKKFTMKNKVENKKKTQEERIQEIEKELEDEELDDEFFGEDEEENNGPNTIENFRLHKSLIIAETEKAVLIKIGKGAFWLNKNFIIPSKYSVYNQIGIVHEFTYICEINETKKEVSGSKLIKLINEYKDRRKQK